MRTYYILHNVGRAKYVINFDQGNKHKDGSPLFDIKICSNKRDAKRFTDKLEAEGYIYQLA